MKTLIIFLFTAIGIYAQLFYPTTWWKVEGEGIGFSVEAYDLNQDNKKDVFVGNFNTTDVYYAGYGILDNIRDAQFRGRMLAICDFNGDTYADLITMHLTGYDSSRMDYNGEILFYWGRNHFVSSIDTTADYSIPLPNLRPQKEGFGAGYFQWGVEVGDLNNDGKEDLVINAYDYGYYDSDIHTRVGRVYIYLGNSVPSDTPNYIMTGKFIPGQILQPEFGWYFQVGDINRDGIDDLLVGSSIKTIPPNPKDSLEVLHVFYGGTNFNFAHGSESLLYKSKIKTGVLPNWAEWFNNIFSIEDINGDGWQDLLVARNLWPVDSFKVTVHNGGANGIDTIPYFTFSKDTNGNGGVPLSWALNCGDINNDGFNDFIFPSNPWILVFGGPYVNNRNPRGSKGSYEYLGTYPMKAVNIGRQNNDIQNDFLICASAYGPGGYGFAEILLGTDLTTGLDNEKLNQSGNNDFYAFPNPFQKKCTIKFIFNEKESVKITIYDSMGGKITELLDRELESGEHKIEFDAEGRGFSSGIYFVEIDLGKRGKQSLKLIYLK